MTNCELSFEISDSAKEAGLALRFDTIEYRGNTVNFLSDLQGDRCFAQWNDILIDLGLHNIYYKEDACRFIDQKLDTISLFRNSTNFVGAKLEWFQNGDHRDIKLSYKGRILKVFLVSGHINEIELISECEKLLINSGVLEDGII